VPGLSAFARRAASPVAVRETSQEIGDSEDTVEAPIEPGAEALDPAAAPTP